MSDVSVHLLLLDPVVNGVSGECEDASEWTLVLFSFGLFDQYMWEWRGVSTDRSNHGRMFVSIWLHWPHLSSTFVSQHGTFAWSRVPSTHLGDTCVTSPCKHGGGCVTLLADTGTSWSAYRCVCPSGIYGQRCDMRNRNNWWARGFIQVPLFFGRD